MENRRMTLKAPSRTPQPASRAGGPVEILALGASTGGPKALAEVLRPLPADFPVPIVIVQHMPPDFTKYLAVRLNAVSHLAVEEAVARKRICPGGAWLAPGNHH